jgi:hypothetical protein
MLGRIAFRPKGGPEPIGTIDIRPAPLPLRGAFTRAARIAGGRRLVERVVVPVAHPFVEITGQACRSSGSAVAAKSLRAFEASDLGKHNRRKGESQT